MYDFNYLRRAYDDQRNAEVLDAKFLYGAGTGRSGCSIRFFSRYDERLSLHTADSVPYSSPPLQPAGRPDCGNARYMLHHLCRGKMPDEHMAALAKGKSIAVLATEHFMFTTCGILYENGLRGGA